MTGIAQSRLVRGFANGFNTKKIESVNLTINDINETRKDVIVTISGDEVAEQESRILKSFMKQAKVPGFRPGKAPESRIRQLYNKEIHQELRTSVMRSAYEEVMKNEELNVYSVVEFPEPGALLSGQEVNIDLTVDITPEFELPEYKGIETNPPPTTVDDAEIDGTIERIRRQRAEFEVVEREAAASDYVKLSYSGMIDGEPIAGSLEENPNLRAWGEVKDGWEEAGTEEAKTFGVPAVIDAVVGMKAGDKKSVEQVIADDFEIEDLRGKTVTYEVEVSEVRERKLPEMDEDFLKGFNAESIEDLKAQIMDDLENRKKQDAQDAQRRQILDHLAGKIDIPLPQSAVEAETQAAVSRLISQNMQMGTTEDELEKHRDEIFSGAGESAKREVKLQIVLSRIAKKEEIQVENEDLSRAVYSMAMQRRQKPEDLAKELRKDREQLMHLQRQILFAKTLELLLKESKTTTEEKA